MKAGLLIFIDLFNLNLFKNLFDFFKIESFNFKTIGNHVYRIQYPINYMVVNQMLPLISFAYITTTKSNITLYHDTEW